MKQKLKLDSTRKKIIIGYVIVLLIGLSYYLYMRTTGHHLNCPLFESTGMYCPGCGITRACVNIIHLNFYAGFRDHPAFVSIAFVWIVISVMAFIGKPAVFRNSKVNIIILYVCLALYIVFSIFRNIPGFEFLQPMDNLKI